MFQGRNLSSSPPIKAFGGKLQRGSMLIDSRLRGNDALYYLITTWLFAFLLPSFALALHADKKEIAYITADGGIYNFKTGVNQFDGHVRIDQGSTHLTADRLITKSNNKHKIQEAIAYGFTDLAHYWTLLKPEDPEMHGRARVIRYFPLASNITLEREALVTKGTDSFQGELIHYNSVNQTIAVPALEKNHAILVYNPDQ